MNVAAVRNIEIEGCKVPESLPLLSIFNCFGGTSIARLSLKYNNKNQDLLIVV